MEEGLDTTAVANDGLFSSHDEPVEEQNDAGEETPEQYPAAAFGYEAV
jgi:hypothetical protein